MIESEYVDLFLPGDPFGCSIVFRRDKKSMKLLARLKGILDLKYFQYVSLFACHFSQQNPAAFVGKPRLAVAAYFFKDGTR